MCNMALVEDFLDEVALSDNDSESEQLHESTVYLKNYKKKNSLCRVLILRLQYLDQNDLYYSTIYFLN